MRKLLLIIALLAGMPLFAQSPVTVTGHTQAGSGSAVTSGTFVRFVLDNYGANVPRVLGTGVIVAPQPPDVYPNGSGQFTTTLWGNDNISPTGTDWIVQYWYNGQMTSTAYYTITGTGTFNLDTATSNTISPVIPSPTGDSTYLRLDAGNQNLLNSAFWASPSGPIGSITPVVINPKREDTVRYAGGFAGSDCGAKIMAADFDLGSTAGEIWISQSCGTTISTAVAPSANHVLRWVQGGTWTFSGSGKITMNYPGNSIYGSGQNALTFDCSALSGDCIRWQMNPWTSASVGAIRDLTLTGGSNASNVGIHIGDVGYARIENVTIQGFIGTSGAGIWQDNVTNWTEGYKYDNVWLNNNTVGWKLTNSGCASNDSNNSMGYGDVDFRLQVNANQVGIQSSGLAHCRVTLYNSHIHTRGNASANTATWINAKDNSTWYDNWYDLRGECSGCTGTGRNIASTATVRGYGTEILDNLGDVCGPGATYASSCRILSGVPSSAAGDTGSVSNFLATGNTASPELIGIQGIDNPYGFWLWAGSIFPTPAAVLLPESGANCFLVQTLAANAAPNTASTVSCLDDQGNAKLGGGLFLGTATGASGHTQLIDNSGSTVQGVTGALYGVANSGNSVLFTYDKSGNEGVAGNVVAGGTAKGATLQAGTGLINDKGLQVATGTYCTIASGAFGNGCFSTVALAVTEPDTSYNVVGCTTTQTNVTLGEVQSKTTTNFQIAVASRNSSTPSSSGTVTCLVTH